MNIGLIGKTGSGKTTIAKKLRRDFGLTIINGAENVRKYIDSKRENWEIVEKCLREGELPPLEIRMKVLQLFFESCKAKNFVYDNLISPDYIDAFEKRHGFDHLFYLDVANETAEKRVLSRARDENAKQYIRNRNNWFMENIRGLEDSHGERLIRIDANVDMDAVYSQILRHVGVPTKLKMQKLIKQIEAFTPSCEQEEVDKALFLKVARENNKSLTRESQLAHFTASAFVINKARTKVVCVFHNLLKAWTFTGGHNDGDDDFLSVAKKEAEEESGITDIEVLGDGIFSLDTFCCAGHFKHGKYVPSHVHLNATFVFITCEKNLRIKPDENSDIAWLDIDEIVTRNAGNFRASVFQKIIDKIRSFK